RHTRSKRDWSSDVCSSDLHWIPEGEEVIAGVARALKPGGRFVAEFGGKGNICRLVAGFQRAFAALGQRQPDGVSPWFYPSVAERSEERRVGKGRRGHGAQS